MAATTYSFLNVQAAIVGPGGGFQIGSGAGAAEEGISIEPVSDIDVMNIGADGSVAHSLIANKGAKVTIRLQKTSPTNLLLSAMMALQRASAANHGQNTITIVDTVRGDAHTLQLVAFAKAPPIPYAKEAGIVEWEFNAGVWDLALGAGV